MNKVGMFDMYKNIGNIQRPGNIQSTQSANTKKGDLALPNMLCGCQNTNQMQPFNTKRLFG